MTTDLIPYRLTRQAGSRLAFCIDNGIENYVNCESCRNYIRGVVLYLISGFLRGNLSPVKFIKDLRLLFKGQYSSDLNENDFKLCTTCKERLSIIRQELIALSCLAINLPYESDCIDNVIESNRSIIKGISQMDIIKEQAQDAVVEIINELAEDMEENDDRGSHLQHEANQVIDSLLQCEEITYKQIGIIINCFQLTGRRVLIPQEAAVLIEPIIPRKKDLSVQIYTLLCKLYGQLHDEDSESDDEIPAAFYLPTKPPKIASDLYKNDGDEYLKTVCDQRKFRGSMIIRIEQCINELQYYVYDRGYRWIPTPFLVSTLKQCFGSYLTTEIITKLLTASSLYASVVVEALEIYLKEIQPNDNDRFPVINPFATAVEQLTIQDLKVQPEAGNKINRKGFVDAQIERLRHICPGFGQGGELPWYLGKTLRTFIHDGLLGRVHLSSATNVKKFIESLLQIFRGNGVKPKVLKIRTAQIESFLRFFRLFYMLSYNGMDIYLFNCNFYGNVMDKEAKTMIDARSVLFNQRGRESESERFTGLMEYIFKDREPVENPFYPKKIIQGRLKYKLNVWDELCGAAVEAIYPLVHNISNLSAATTTNGGSTGQRDGGTQSTTRPGGGAAAAAGGSGSSYRPLISGDILNKDIQLSYEGNKIIFALCQ